MNKLQRLERIEEEARLLRAEIESEAEQREAEEEWPKEGDRYFIVDSNGAVDAKWRVPLSFTEERIAYGNCYRTREEAQRIANHRKDPVAQAREKLAAFAFDYNDGKCLSVGWVPLVQHNGSLIMLHFEHHYLMTCFKDSEGLQAAINALGEDLIKTACGCGPV